MYYMLNIDITVLKLEMLETQSRTDVTELL